MNFTELVPKIKSELSQIMSMPTDFFESKFYIIYYPELLFT